MDELVPIIYWVIIFVIFYVYLGYTLMVIILGNFVKKNVKKIPITPTVSFIIAAYNEEAAIEKKLINTLDIDYPKGKFEIVVASDGSTDKTDEIVKRFKEQGIKLFRVEGRVGKTETRNQAVVNSKSEIIVFSDATTHYRHDAVKKLVRNFADEKVGQVSGKYDYFDPSKTHVGIGTKLFWKYENLIKNAQTKFGTMTGASGCINAFRRTLYTTLPPEIIEDLVVPLMTIKKGYRVVFEPDAQAFEKTTQRISQELIMRIRVIRGGMKGLLYAKELLNPLKYPLPAFQLISHKVLRWLMPVFLIALLLSNILLLFENSFFFTVSFIMQITFYIAAGVGCLLMKVGIKLKLLSLPIYFCVVNYASLIALYKTLTSDLEHTWETNV